MIRINMFKNALAINLVVFLNFSNVQAQDLFILPNGHSHNDYTREKPLYDALKYGFPSIEADVFLFENRMVVTHDDKQLNEKPTLEELYLNPLRKIINENGGTVFKNDSTQLILMVDLKSGKVDAYNGLKKIFSNYLDLIEWYDHGEVKWGAIKILLTGEPPIDRIENEDIRYFYVDGAIGQWSMDYPINLMPRASANYRDYFKWYGKGAMPPSEVQQLKMLISKAHQSGRKVRFWGCPNTVDVWEKLLGEGVDWINVDDLKGFSEFYMKRIQQK